jgi:Fe2+ or Zn2+ uptake regulation protein
VKTEGTKRRILALYTLLDTTKEKLTVKQIIAKLENQYDIKVERKTIYDDLAVLKEFVPLTNVYRNSQVYYFVDWSSLRGDAE